MSAVAQGVQVREAMRGAQRAFLAEGDAVAEGRDIGEVVWPQAELKVWLDADPEMRARRRGDARARWSATAATARRRSVPGDAVRVDTTGLVDRRGRDAHRGAWWKSERMSDGFAPGDQYRVFTPDRT